MLEFTSNYVRDINQKLSVSYKYGDGYPVLKELIQNADDAGASELRVYVVDGIQNAKTSLLRQPAVIIFNNGEFKPEHLENIRTMSVDSKTNDDSKIGRYGLGMKSIFHICDAFIFAICNKEPDFKDIKVDCISPWGKNDPDHDYKDFPDDEEKRLIIQNLPFDLKKENGFVLYLPIQEPGKPHVIQEHKIFKEKPFGVIDDVLENLGTTLPLLCEVSPTKSLKTVKYFVTKQDCRSVSVHNDRKVVETNNGEEHSQEKYRVYNAQVSEETLAKFVTLTKNENWNRREEKNGIKPEITYELIRNDRKSSELNFKYCVYLPMEEPKIPSIAINTKNGFTILVHGNFAIDSGRRGFIGYSTLLNKQEDTVIEGTESLQIMWNKILAQEIMFPEFPKFLEHCVKTGLLTVNKSTDEVSEFLNAFKNIKFDTIPFINEFTCTRTCFGKVVSLKNGKSELNWKPFDSHLNLIKLPEISDFAKVLEIMPSSEACDCIFIAHNDEQYQVIPENYEPNSEIIKQMFGSLTEKTLTDISLCKWFKAFLLLNKKVLEENEILLSFLILKIRQNLVKCELSELFGNSKNLGELLTAVNKLSGNSCKKFFTVNIKDENYWKKIWNDNEEFVFVPSFLDVTDNYIEDVYVIGKQKSICHYLESSDSIPAESHYDILERILGKKKLEDLFQTIADNFKTLSVFRIRNIQTNKEENATRAKLNSLVERKQLFYRSSDLNLRDSAPIKLYAKLLGSVNLYFISKSSFFKDENILSPDEEQDILKSFQLQDYKNIEYDNQILADFLEKIFANEFTIPQDSAKFYRFLFTNCNKELADETICFNNGDEIWKKIYKHIKPNTIFIPDNFREYTKRQVFKNEIVLKIFQLDARHCLQAMKDSHDLSFFKEDDYFRSEDIQEKLFKEFQESDKELFLKIPLQYDCITKSFVAPREKTCYLNSNGITIPNGLIPNFSLIEPSTVELLAEKQKRFLNRLEYKKAAETFIALGSNQNINILDETFSLLSHIDDWKDFSDSSACGCALVKWIPTRNSFNRCSVIQVLDDGVFPESVTQFLTLNFDLYAKDDLALTEEQFIKMHSKRMIPGTYERLFACFVEPFSEKLSFKIQFDTFEHFKSACTVLRDFKLNPVYGAMHRLLESCTAENSKDLLFALYMKLQVKASPAEQINALDNCLKYLSTRDISTPCVSVFSNILKKLIDLDKTNFRIEKYEYPVQDDTWKNASEIAATNDRDYEPGYLLKQSVFELLKSKAIIPDSKEGVTYKASEFDDVLTSEESIEKIRETFAPWFACESLEHPKLLYLLFLLLQGNFSKYALGEKNITYFESAFKDYQLDTKETNSTLWINNLSESEVFSSFNHFKTIIHIPKGDMVSLLNLQREVISVPQSNTENPNTLFRDPAWMEHPNAESNIFHLELKKITSSVQELDRKLQELIESQILARAYRQHFNNSGYKLFTSFLETNQNTIRSTVLYIFDSLFDKLNGMGLKSNKDFKSLYTQYSELFTRQISAENEKESSEQLNKYERIAEDKKKLNEELRKLILSNNEMQKDIHSAVKKQISKNQYSVSRILYELLQNADDAVCDIENSPVFENRRSFSIVVAGNKFIVSHYGRRINETPAGSDKYDKYQFDLKNMLALNASDKEAGDTGQFGLGFKSIYLASNQPVIRSGELQFRIVAALYPQKLEVEEKLKDFETRIEFELTEENVKTTDLISKFKKTAAIQPLLCRGINQISIKVNSNGTTGDNSYTVKTLETVLDGSYGKIRLVNLDGQNYYVMEEANNLYKMILKEKDGRAEIFKSSSKDSMPRIWNLAPFAEYENLPFIINANFYLDTGRTSLSKVDDKNKLLLDEISDCVSQLLCELYKDNESTAGLFDSFLHIFLFTSHSPEKLFADFAKRILKSILTGRNVIPTGAKKTILYTNEIYAISANSFGLKPDENEFIAVLDTIQTVFRKYSFIVSNTVKEALGQQQWKQIDSYEMLLTVFSELHDSVLDNECMQAFLKILNMTNRSEQIHWSAFKLYNKDGIPKQVTSFAFRNDSSGKFETMSKEYSQEVLEYFSPQEFAKNNEIRDKEEVIASQKVSLESITKERDQLKELIRRLESNNADDLDLDEEIDSDTNAEHCSVIDIYHKWRNLSNREWENMKQQYYSRLFPSVLMNIEQRNKDLSISPEYFESYDSSHPTMPLSWCILFMLGTLQSLNYWGEARSESARKNKIESMMDLITDFANGDSLDSIYDKYLNTHETDESDLSEFESLLRVYKFRRKFMQIWAQFYGIKHENSVELNMLLNASASADASGKGLGSYASQKSLKYGISMIVRELLDSGFFGDTEQEQEKAFELLNKFTYIPHAYLRRIVFNDMFERPEEKTSEEIHDAIRSQLESEGINVDEIKAFMKCHDLPFLILGEKK